MRRESVLQREGVRDAFARYVAAYDCSDPKIALKVAHTYRVASLCDRIGVSAGVDNIDLMWLCGMLHDIGRFEQVRRYGSLVDAQSVDHAQLGADLLFCEGLLERVVPDRAVLTPDDRGLLEKAIRNHNRFRLEEGLTARERTYCDVLRDADKVDIFRVICETPLEDIYNITTEELRASAVGAGARAAFDGRTALLRSLKSEPIDHLVGHICLVFELVYPLSRQIAREQGYVDRLLAFESDNPETHAWFDHMRAQLWD